LLLLATGCAGNPSNSFHGRVMLDLTHPFDAQTIYWPTGEGFRLHEGFAGITDGGYYYESNSFSAPEHGGTHLDAPIHFAEGHLTLDAIPVERLIGPGVVTDISDACAVDTDYLVSLEDFEAWESAHGRLPEGAIVLLHTGFGAYWPNRGRYLGTDERGPEAVSKLHFPGLDPDAATWLIGQRSIRAVGLDTPSIDRGQSTTFDAHVRLFEHDIPAFENVAHLDRLPVRGFSVIALPMKIAGGSGGPLRIIAILD